MWLASAAAAGTIAALAAAIAAEVAAAAVGTAAEIVAATVAALSAFAGALEPVGMVAVAGASAAIARTVAEAFAAEVAVAALARALAAVVLLARLAAAAVGVLLAGVFLAARIAARVLLVIEEALVALVAVIARRSPSTTVAVLVVATIVAVVIFAHAAVASAIFAETVQVAVVVVRHAAAFARLAFRSAFLGERIVGIAAFVVAAFLGFLLSALYVRRIEEGCIGGVRRSLPFVQAALFLVAVIVVRVCGNVFLTSGFGFELALMLGGALKVALACALFSALAAPAVEFALATAFASALALAFLLFEEIRVVVGKHALIGALDGRKGVFRNLEIHFGDVLAGEFLNAAQQIACVGGDERNGEAIGACAARASDAVDVVFGKHGQIVVHHVVDFGHIDAAGEHVGSHEHVGFAFAEIVQRAAALRLAAVGVDRFGRNADATQAFAAVIGSALGSSEDDNAIAALFLDERIQQLGLLATRGFDYVLVDFVGGFAAVRDFHDGRVVQDAEHGFVLAAVDGRAEQQRLAIFWRGFDDALHLRPKAHVEHAVGFVEHQHLYLGEVGGPALHEVDHAAGGGDSHVEPALELLDLRPVGNAAHEGAHEMVRMLADGHACVGDLARQLARRGDDQHERTAIVAFAVGQLVHGGQRERGGFAGAGFCCGDKVATLQDQRNRLLLDGGCVGVAQRVNGFQGILGKAEFGERSNGVLLFSGALCDANECEVARGKCGSRL